MKIKLNSKAKAAVAGIVLTMTIPTAIASTWTIEPSVTYALYEFKPEQAASYDSALAMLNVELEIEDGMGNFHRGWLSRSVYENEEKNHGMDTTLTQGVYRIGKYFYPKAEPTDFSMWTGLGYWEAEFGKGVSETKDKYVYLPFGLEYATPMDNRGAWPTGFSAQRNHSHFFVMGAEFNFLVHGEGASNAWKENSGYGYRAWLGYDYRMSDKRILTTVLDYKAWAIDEVSKTNLLGLTIGLRFL